MKKLTAMNFSISVILLYCVFRLLMDALNAFVFEPLAGSTGIESLRMITDWFRYSGAFIIAVLSTGLIAPRLYRFIHTRSDKLQWVILVILLVLIIVPMRLSVTQNTYIF